MDGKQVHELMQYLRDAKGAYAVAMWLRVGDVLCQLRTQTDGAKMKNRVWEDWIIENTGMSRTNIREAMRCYVLYNDVIQKKGVPEGVTPSHMRILLPVLKAQGTDPEAIHATLTEYGALSISDLRKRLREDKGEEQAEICTHEEIICKKCKAIIDDATLTECADKKARRIVAVDHAEDVPDMPAPEV